MDIDQLLFRKITTGGYLSLTYDFSVLQWSKNNMHSIEAIL